MHFLADHHPAACGCDLIRYYLLRIAGPRGANPVAGWWSRPYNCRYGLARNSKPWDAPWTAFLKAVGSVCLFATLDCCNEELQDERTRPQELDFLLAAPGETGGRSVRPFRECLESGWFSQRAAFHRVSSRHGCPFGAARLPERIHSAGYLLPSPPPGRTATGGLWQALSGARFRLARGCGCESRKGTSTELRRSS